MNYEGIYREKEGATRLIKRPRKLWLTVSTVREIGRLQRSIRVLASMTNASRILRTNCFDLSDETATDFPSVHRINFIHCFTKILSPLCLCTLIRYCFTFYLHPFLLFRLYLFSSFRSSFLLFRRSSEFVTPQIKATETKFKTYDVVIFAVA